MFSLFICLFLCMFHYMLKMARERFTSVFFPRGVAGILFLPIFLDLYFFDVQLSISWETVILIKFYWCSWYSSDGCPAKEKFLQHVPLGVGPFWGMFHHFSLFLHFMFPYSVQYWLIKFLAEVLGITLTFTKLWKYYGVFFFAGDNFGDFEGLIGVGFFLSQELFNTFS